MPGYEIEWVAKERKPFQRAKRIDGGRDHVDTTQLVRDLTGIRDRVAAAHRIRKAATVTISWRRTGMARADWAEFPG